MGFLDAAEAENQQSTASGNQYGGDVFADVNNLDHCIKYLNQSLTTFGFPSTLHLYSNDPASIVQTCNCLYALLQQRQRDIEFRDAANDQKQRLMSDMTRLEAKLERQEAQLIAKERELAALISKEQKAAAAHKAQLEKLQQERDEFQRMVVSTQQVRVQQSHELKKKEKEYVRLQEKLNQVLAEKKKETKPALEILSLLQKEGRQRGTWNNKKADGDFYKMIVDAYEAKKQELMAENTDLRSLLRSMQSDMRDFLNTHNGMGKATSVNGSFDAADRPSTPLAGRTDVFDLPFHMARDQIEQSLRTKMASIKERMMQLQESQQALRNNTEATDRELELEAQLVEARSIITEQVSLMNKQLTEDPRTSAPAHITGKGAPAFLGADEDRVAIEEWTQLEAERSAIKKMTADLERERLEVEKSKERLQEEQASWARSVNLWAGRLGGAKDLPGKNDLWPENQNAKPEVANMGRESSKNQTETQVSLVDAQMDPLGTQIAKPECQTSHTGSLEASAEKRARLVDAQYNVSQSQFFGEKTQNENTGTADSLRVRRTKSLSEVPKWSEDRRTEYKATSDVFDTQKAGPSSQAMWKESSSTSRCNSSRMHGKFTGSQETGSVGRSSRIYDYQKIAALDNGHHPEKEASQLIERNVSRTSHRRGGSKDEIFTELTKHQSCRHSDRTEISKPLSKEISRTDSQRWLAGKQAEQSFRRTEHARSWSSSRRNSEQRIHPEFRFIADDAWVDDSQSVQTTASELDTQKISFKGVHSQRSTSSSRVEPKREGEPDRMSSRRMDVASTSNGQKKKEKDQQASCGCFHVFSRNS